MFSGNPDPRPRACGCPTRASLHIVAADRIAVLGAGSVGCFIGGAWAAAGLPVSFIGRARIAHDIREHGLALTDYAGWRAELHDVDYACIPAALGDAEIILVCVKSG